MKNTIMKNLVLILSVAISLSILSGCRDSDDLIDPSPDPSPDPGPDDDIVGYWKMTKIIKDGVDLTDDCTTRSDMTISNINSFTGKDYDYDAVQNTCPLTTFGGGWVHETGNRYTFEVLGNEWTQELNGDTLTGEFIHAFDGQHYIEEHVRQQ